MSTDAGSTGLDLQNATLLNNLDIPWNPAILEQRIARIHRMGQKSNVQIINLVARGTIEQRMLDTLAFKRDLAEEQEAAELGEMETPPAEPAVEPDNAPQK